MSEQGAVEAHQANGPQPDQADQLIDHNRKHLCFVVQNRGYCAADAIAPPGCVGSGPQNMSVILLFRHNPAGFINDGGQFLDNCTCHNKTELQQLDNNKCCIAKGTR